MGFYRIYRTSFFFLFWSHYFPSINLFNAKTDTPVLSRVVLFVLKRPITKRCSKESSPEHSCAIRPQISTKCFCHYRDIALGSAISRARVMVQSWHSTQRCAYPTSNSNDSSTDKHNVMTMTIKVSNDRATTKDFLGPRYGRSPVIVHLSPLEAQFFIKKKKKKEAGWSK